MKLAVLKFRSLGAAYQVANQTTKDIEIFELSPLGSQSQLLLSSTRADFESWLQSQVALCKEEVVDFVVISNISPLVLKAYLSQLSHKPQESLLIVESSSLGAIFQVAQRVAEGEKADQKIIDLRCLRTEGGPSYLILTQIQRQDLAPILNASLKVTEIPAVNAALSPFFIS